MAQFKIKLMIYPRNNCYDSFRAFTSTRDSKPLSSNIESEDFIYTLVRTAGSVYYCYKKSRKNSFFPGFQLNLLLAVNIRYN